MVLDSLDSNDDIKQVELEILEQFPVQSAYLEESDADDRIRITGDTFFSDPED